MAKVVFAAAEPREVSSVSRVQGMWGSPLNWRP
jgi:hypothetical protein